MKILNTNDVKNSVIKIVVAGEAGNGKTSLAKTIQVGLNEKVLVISAEAGLLSLKGSGVDYVELQTDDNGNPVAIHERIKRLGEIYDDLKKPEYIEKYQWIFIDSLTEIQQNLMNALEATEKFSDDKDNRSKFGELAKKMETISKRFRDMTEYNVIFSSLVKVENNADGIPVKKLSLVGSYADKMPAHFDCLLYLGVTDEIDEKTKLNKRILLTNRTDKIDFPKDRSGRLDKYEPADLSLIVKKIRGTDKPLIADISAKGKEAHAAEKEQKAAAANK